VIATTETALDVTVQAQILELLRRCGRDGLSFLSSPMISAWPRRSPTMPVLYGGRLARWARNDVLNRPPPVHLGLLESRSR